MPRSLSHAEFLPKEALPFQGCPGPGFGRRGGGWTAPAMSDKRAALRCRVAREIASAVLDVPVEEIARPNRSAASTCHARHLAIYVAHVVFQVPLAAIALEFGRDRTSVAHAIRRIEDGRDEKDIERLVVRLERLAEACLEFSEEGAGT